MSKTYDHVKNYRGLSQSINVVIAAMDRTTDHMQAHHDTGKPYQINLSAFRTSLALIEAACSTMADKTVILEETT